MDRRAHDSYGIVAISLHWLITIGILVMIPLGWWMTSHVTDPAWAAQVFRAYQLHKSIGLTILILSLVRLLWRLAHPFPQMPAHMPGWAKFAARVTHLLLYGVIIGMPVTGWLYVSAGWNTQMNAPFEVPTLWFGLFQWPHLPVAHASEPTRAAVAGTAISIHAWLAWGAVGLIALHVAAALKHHLFDRDYVLAGMLPFVRSRGLRVEAGEIG